MVGISRPVDDDYGWLSVGFVPISVYVGFLWAVHCPSWRIEAEALFIVAGTLAACLLMPVIGVRGPETGGYWGYLMGGGIAGCVYSSMVVAMSKTIDQEGGGNQSKRRSDEDQDGENAE